MEKELAFVDSALDFYSAEDRKLILGMNAFSCDALSSLTFTQENGRFFRINASTHTSDVSSKGTSGPE